MTRVAAVAAMAAALLTAACTGSPRATGSTSPTPAFSPLVAAVTYKVTGEAPKVRIHYGVTGKTVAVTTKLPWEAEGQAPVGADVEMSAFGLGQQGYRIACVLTITTPGKAPYPSYDSSHAIGTGGPLGNPILYDDQCNTASTVPPAPTSSG
jgi:hypothetical protein